MGRAAAGPAEVLLPPPFRRTVRRSRRDERDRGRSEAVGGGRKRSGRRRAGRHGVQGGRPLFRPARSLPQCSPADADGFSPGGAVSGRIPPVCSQPGRKQESPVVPSEGMRCGRGVDFAVFRQIPAPGKETLRGRGKQRGGKALNEGRIRPEGRGPVIKEHDEKERRSALSARQTGGFSCPVRKERGGNRRAARLGQQGRRPHHRHPLLVCGAVQTAGRRRPYIGPLKASILIASGECPCVLSY